MSTASFAPIVTARLMVRALVPDDAAAIHRLVNDWEVAKNLARVPFPYPRALADEWAASTVAQVASGTGWHLGIERDGGLIGNIGLTLDRDRRGAELGYWIGRSHWGHGYVAEAAAALIEWAGTALRLERVHASALTDHARSQAVLRRLGFVETGGGRSAFVSRGRSMAVRHFTRVLATAAEAPAHAVSVAAAPDNRPCPDAPVAAAPGAVDGAAPVAGRTILLVVACALIDPDGRVLLARRPVGKPMAGLWEFPGGKLAPGETPEAALIRELAEELGIGVAASCLAPFAFASHPLEDRHLLMPLFVCRKWEGIPEPREGQSLAWVRPARLADYAMPPADRPLVAMLRDLL